MTENQFIYEEKYRVRAYEIDLNKQMTAPALLRLMHETAQQQVVRLNLSVWDLEAHHISWVLARINFHIVRLPKLGEEITIRTNPTSFEKVFTFRDYRVFDANGKLLAWASSTWLLMNTKTRKVTRIPDFIQNLPLAKDIESLPKAPARLAPLSKVDKELPFRVKWYDLDFNQHLNNIFYLQWMLESMDFEVLSQKQVQEVRIIYKKEAHYKEDFLSQSQQVNDQQFLHRLIRKSDQEEIARAESIWV